MSRTRRLVVAALALAMAAPLAAAPYSPYPDLRRENPAIDDAIATLDASDLHGTLGRLSALMRRRPIRDVPEDGDYAALPESWSRGLAAALDDLHTDLADADEQWAEDELAGVDRSAERGTLLQVVNLVVAERVRELHADYPFLSCGTSEPIPWSCPMDESDPAALQDLHALIPGLLGDWLSDVIEHAEDETGSTYEGRGVIGFSGKTYPDHVGDLASFIADEEAAGRVPGIPSIDRVPGIPSID